MTVTHYNLFKMKCIEPIKRKHGSNKPEWILHRFPIKNGISWQDAMLYDMLQQCNPFWNEIDRNNK